MVSGFVYFLGNLDAFDSLEEKEASIRGELDSLHLKKETDRNATSAEISALLRARSAYRQEKEELEDNSIGDREEMNALERKFSKENENFKELEQKLADQRDELEKLNVEIGKEEEAQQPLISQNENLSKELEAEIGIRDQKRIEMEEINAEITKMNIFISHISEETSIVEILKDWIESTFLGQCEVFASSDKADLSMGNTWITEID